MSERHENSLQTATRWGRNVLIGIGVAYVLFKFVNAWLGAWYRLFPGVRRHMERKYGREQGYIEFVSKGAWLLVALPIVAFLVLAIVAFLDDQLQLGFAAGWERLWAIDESNHGEFVFWIVFALMLPWVLAAVITMFGGIVASIRPGNDKRRAPAPVSRFTLWLCFYLLAVPTALVVKLADSDYGGWALTVLALTALWHLFRWGIRRTRVSATSSATAPAIEVVAPASVNPNSPPLHPKGRKTPRNTILGYVEQFSGDEGHGHPLPRNNDPFREWIASMWEAQLRGELAKKHVYVELPRLSTKANASRCRKILSEHGLPASFEFPHAIVEMRTAYSAEDVVMHMGGILNRNGTAVVVCVVDGEVNVFTRELGTKFPHGFLTTCREMIRIQPETPVAWYQAMDAQPLATVAALALYGQAPNQSAFSSFTGNKLYLLRQRFVSPNRCAAPSEQEASDQI